MDVHIFIALVSGLLNAGLSVVVPCLLKKTEQPFLVQVKKVFDTNRQVIMTSSLIVVLTTYLALKVAPEVSPAFGNLTGLDFQSQSLPEVYRPQVMVRNVDEFPMELRNLVQLMNR